MAALPEPRPRRPRPGVQMNLTGVDATRYRPERTTLNQYGRDPESPAERLRKLTTWHECDAKKFTGKGDFVGFTPFPHSFFADLHRLPRSMAQRNLLDIGWIETYGRARKSKNDPPPLFTPDIPIKDLANRMRCSERQALENIEDALNRLDHTGKRKAPLIQVKGKKGEDIRDRGSISFRLLLENWERAADGDADFSAQTEEPATAEPEQTEPLTETGVVNLRFGARKRSPRIPIQAEAKELQILDQSPAGSDFEFKLSAAVVRGVIRLTTCIESSNANGQPNGINDVGGANGGGPMQSPTRARPTTPAGKTGEKNHKSNSRPTEINNLTNKSGGVPPKEADAESLIAGLRHLGYGVNPSYGQKLAAALPSDCPVDFALRTVQERRDRPGAKPLAEPMLLRFFEEDIPTKWKFQQERGAELATDWKNDRAFAAFAASYAETCAALIPKDFERAYEYWQTLSLPERMERAKALQKHKAGWDDPAFIPRPRKFLEEDWERPVVVKKRKGVISEQSVKFLDALQEMRSRGR